MALAKQCCATEACPLETVDVEHLAQLLAAEWQEWIEHDSEVSYKLQREVQDCSHATHVALCELPWLSLGKVTVTDACKLHSLLLCLAELVLVEQVLNALLYVYKLGNDSVVVVGELAAGRNLAVEIFLGEYQCTVHEVTVNGNELVVVACLEILPCEVVVLGLRRICCEYITQYVLLAWEINEIFVEPYGPVA